MFSRRLVIMLLLGAVVVLGLVLYANLRPSSLFRIAAPAPTVVAPTSAESLATLKNNVSNTLGSISGTALLDKPRYTGQDDLGRNWLVTAESAGQEGSTTSNTYVLNQVQATFSSPSQTTPFNLSADTGRYQQTSSTLALSGNVSATGIGFNLTAPQVDADLTTRTLKASGGSRVIGNTGGPKGWDVNITAPTLTADQNSSRLVLTGGVHATFTPNGK